MSEVLFCLCWCCPNTVNISEWKTCPSAYNETFILNNAAPAHTARQNTQETTNDMETDQLANKYSSHKTEEELAARFNTFLPNVRQEECVFTTVWKYTWHWRIFHNNACAWNKMHLCVTSCIKLNTVIILTVLFPPSCLENLDMFQVVVWCAFWSVFNIHWSHHYWRARWSPAHALILSAWTRTHYSVKPLAAEAPPQHLQYTKTQKLKSIMAKKKNS